MQQEQEIRFCTAPDGVSIAYATSGSGPPLVNAANYLRHLEFDWQSPVWIHWLEELGRHHTYIRYDERGTGLSDWDVADLSFEAWVSDLETVVDAADLEQFSLLGMSQGGPVAIAYAARHPDRVSRLILYGSYARGWSKRDLSADQRQEEELLISLMRIGWGRDNPAFRQFFIATQMPEATPEQMQWFDELMRRSTTPENAAKLELEMHNIDVSQLAPQVKAPTLILHSRQDAGVPFDEGKRLAQLIPGARFISLESKNHILTRDEAAWVTFVRAFRQFMGVAESEGTAIVSAWHPEPAEAASEPSFGAVVFTDIVDSTAQQRARGDRAWLTLLEQLNSQMDELSAAHDGRVVKSTGDGVMAVFPTPGGALRCASEMVGAAQALGLEIRVGVHAGEVLEVRGDLQGTVVTIASRVADRAEAGEILTTGVVQGLVEGSGYQFVEKGVFDLKGIGRRSLVRFVAASGG